MILVVGAGIVGLATADALLADGHAVTVVDRAPAGDKASFGNAGGLGTSEVVPASIPGLLWKVPGWLADPLGPLSLRPAHLPAMLPWLLRFMRAGRPAEVERITTALASLCRRAADDYRPLLQRLDLAGDLHERGALTVYETRAGFERDRASWDLKGRHGVAWSEMSGDEARRLEPALGRIVEHAVMIPDWAHFSDPKRIVDGLRENLVQRGVEFVTGEATGFDGKALLLQDGQRLDFATAVVAAGAWSPRLAAQLGDRVLLESERGYNTTLPASGVDLSREVIFGERQFVATPLSIGLRIGGAAEFAGLDAPANYRRSKTLVELARLYFPDLCTEGGTQWMGHRPTTPDSLPVIGRSPRRNDIVYAFGHGHTGLTLGPTTGLLVADLIADRAPTLDLYPFSVARF